MHATAANLITCSAPECSQPATVAVPRCRPPEEIRMAVDGRTYLIEHDAILIDYCASCAERMEP